MTSKKLQANGGTLQIGGTVSFDNAPSISGSGFVTLTGAQTVDGAKSFSSEISTDAAHLGGYGLVPVGTIVAYNPGYYTSGSNGGFTISGPAGNSVAQVNSFLNAKGWYVCNGAAVNNTNSPIWNSANRFLPNLDDGRFLRGSTTAGTQGGATTASIDHTHAVTSNVTVGNHTLTVANLPSHDHSIAHDHGSFNTASGGAHIHTKISSRTGGTTAAENVSSPGTGLTAEGGLFNNIWNYTVRSDGSEHQHAIDVPNFTGTSGATGSGAAITHSVTNNQVTSGAASLASISIEPTYLNTFYIIRVF